MYIIHLLPLLALSGCQVGARIPPDSQVNHLAACMHTISRRYLPAVGATLVATRQDDPRSGDRLSWFTPTQRDSMLRSLHSTGRSTFTSFDPCSNNNTTDIESKRQEKAKRFIIFVHIKNDPFDFSYFSFLIKGLKMKNMWHSRAHFIFIANQEVLDSNLHVVVRNIFEILRKELVLNAIVLIAHSRAYVNVYTWFPYRLQGNCGESVKELVVLDRWMMKNEGYFEKNAPLFPTKVPRSLQGCVVLGSTFERTPLMIATQHNTNTSLDDTSMASYDDGLEFHLIRMISEAMDFKVKYLKIPYNHPQLGRWGGQLLNGTWVGALGDVVNKKSDFCAVGLGPENYILKVLDMTTQYLRNRVVWHVPKATLIPHWKSLTVIFHTYLWVILILSFISAFFTFFLLEIRDFRIYQQSSIGFTSMIKTAMSSLSMILGISLPVLPKTPGLRAFFLWWVFYCLLINTAYQSSLISFLTNRPSEPQITTVEGILNSDLEYGFHPIIKTYFQNKGDWRDVRIFNEFTPCYNYTYCFSRVAFKGDYALYAGDIPAEYEITKNYVEYNGKRPFVSLEESSITYYVTMYLTKGSPFMKRFNRVIEQVRDAGLLEKIWEDIKRRNILAATRRIALNKGENTALSVSHLQGAFGLLGIGLLAALLVFIGEIGNMRLIHRNRLKYR